LQLTTTMSAFRTSLRQFADTQTAKQSITETIRNRTIHVLLDGALEAEAIYLLIYLLT